MHSKLPVAHDGLYVTGIFADKRMMQTPYWLLTTLKISPVKQSRHWVAQMHAASVRNFMILPNSNLREFVPLLPLPFVSTSSQKYIRTFVYCTAIHIFIFSTMTYSLYVTMFSLLVIMMRIMTIIMNSNEKL